MYNDDYNGEDIGAFLADRDYIQNNKKQPKESFSYAIKRIKTDKDNSEYKWSIDKNNEHIYTVTCKDGEYSCTCPGFKYRGSCRHLGMVKEFDDLSDQTRHPLSDLTKIYPFLKRCLDEYTQKWDIVGSIRRKKQTFKDIDVIAEISDVDIWNSLCDSIENNEGYARTVRGDLIIRGVYKGISVDINRVMLPSEWIPQLLYRTGSKENNIKMRSRAKAMHLLLNEHGLYHESGIMWSKPEWTERDFYEALNMTYLEPEDR